MCESTHAGTFCVLRFTFYLFNYANWFSDFVGENVTWSVYTPLCVCLTMLIVIDSANRLDCFFSLLGDSSGNSRFRSCIMLIISFTQTLGC